jgi:fumarate hydratase class II
MTEKDYRIEHDTMGEVKVPADKYWGAQTQRSFENFNIGRDHFLMPKEIIKAFAVLKMAAAKANAELGVLSEEKAERFQKQTYLQGLLPSEAADTYPKSLLQTGEE